QKISNKKIKKINYYKKIKEYLIIWTNKIKDIFKDKLGFFSNQLIKELELNISNINKSNLNKFQILVNSNKKILKKIWLKNISNFEQVENLIEKQIKTYINLIKSLVDLIKKYSNEEEIKEMNMNYTNLPKFDIKIYDIENLKNEKIKLMNILNIVKINFNLIQKIIDKKIRHENIFLLQHIHEWIFIETKKINILKPILCSNIQKYNSKNIKKIGYFINEFDYIFVDESGQVNSKYFLYLLALTKKIIVIGDEKQLVPIIDNKNNKFFIEKINKIKEKLSKNEFNYFLDIVSEKLNVFKFNNNNIDLIDNSILKMINLKTNFISKINQNKYKGLYLLEHFRCPKRIFDMINKYFYNKTLIFSSSVEEKTCLISNEIQKYLTCNESSFIQIAYDYDNNNIFKNINYKEISIGINLIIDNLDIMIKHANYDELNEKSIEYLSKNVAFVSLYRNQANSISKILKILSNDNEKLVSIEENKIIDQINNKIKLNFFKKEKLIRFFLNSIKSGTIDSLQGIGCDFIYFSNVNDKPKKNINNFEFNENRINVLWTRTKKHFFHIQSINYWNNFNTSNLKFNFRFEAETSLENSNKVIFYIKNNIDNLSIFNLVKKFKKFNKLKYQINEIGKYGEKIFNNILNDINLRNIVEQKILIELNKNILIKNYFWLNENNEFFKEYDFEIYTNKNKSSYFIDVKSSINKKSNNFYLSNNELKFINTYNKYYIIAKINDISKFNINLKNKYSLAFVIQNITFLQFDKSKNNFSNFNKNEFYYILR
ncbi:AAA domain-containing protein, partial [Mycoplasmoides pirum]